MEKYLPAVCYYPTNVMLIDDDREYLESTSLLLNKRKAFYQYTKNPIQTFHFLSNKYSPNSFTNRCLLLPTEEELEQRGFKVDVRAIHRETNNPDRFSEISVLVVDHQMPGLEGLELCYRLRNKPFKKILLTGVVDETVAVKAFNDGIIDKFIRKDDPDFAKLLNQAIQDLQKKYFHNLSRSIIDCMTSNPETKSDFLLDPIFSDFFEEVFFKLNASEYYLMDSQGSFMFLDANGKPKWLAVKNEAEMQSLVDFAEIEGAPKETIAALVERHQIPYFQHDDQLQTPPQEWNKFFHPAKLLKGNNIYYYAIIEKSELYQLATPVISFTEYLKKQAELNNN